MIFQQCEYELVSPDRRPIELTPDELIHPDATVTARAMTLARGPWPRRFVFFETIQNTDPRDDTVEVFPVYYGFRNVDNGSVTILQGGKPRGWYTSLASAWRRLQREEELWLAWLEPDPNLPSAVLIDAGLEACRHPASSWYLTLPFTAHGPADARQRCLDVAMQLQPCLPGLDRLDVTYRRGGDPDTEVHVFCDAVGCLQPPGHDGGHEPLPLTETDGSQPNP